VTMGTQREQRNGDQGLAEPQPRADQRRDEDDGRDMKHDSVQHVDPGRVLPPRVADGVDGVYEVVLVSISEEWAHRSVYGLVGTEQ
jgi:hypothetical protein